MHFIPSEQIKLIRDLHSRAGIRPIFLRSLASAEKEEGQPFPNFNPEQIPEVKSKFKNQVISTTGLPGQLKPKPTSRFNESY